MKILDYWDNIEKWRLKEIIRLIEGKEGKEGKEFDNPEEEYKPKKRPKKYL